MTGWVLRSAGLLVLLSLPWSSVAGQAIVRGTVVDSASGGPIDGAEILTAGAVIARTGVDGRFVVTLAAGVHDVAARWIGSLPVGQRIRLADRDTVHVVFRLSRAQRLPAITTAAAPPATGGLAGFAERQRDEMGAFITADMLRGQEYRPLSGAIKELATGVRFKHFENETIATGRGGCAMAVWVDGLRKYAGSAATLSGSGTYRPKTGLSVSAASSDGPPNIDNFRIAEIVAIEVYAGPGRTPMQYQLTGSACGTVLIWTKTGQPPSP